METTYNQLNYHSPEIEHKYGSNVHLLSNPFLLTHLSKLCHPGTTQPQINQLVEILYTHLISIAINQVFPKKMTKTETRMAEFHQKEGHFEGEILDQETKVVSVNLARAGTFPSHICYQTLNHLMNPNHIRQDHIIAARTSDESGTVTGTTFSGSKVGGEINDQILIFPDPMGATGGTIVSAVDYYKNQVGGNPKTILALHLIVTPEYLKRVKDLAPNLHVFSIRLDRGLSPPDVLKSIPGTHWGQEKGLNDNQYIVPGGGGLGEILNNVYV